jgi:hypothetical protein
MMLIFWIPETPDFYTHNASWIHQLCFLTANTPVQARVISYLYYLTPVTAISTSIFRTTAPLPDFILW